MSRTIEEIKEAMTTAFMSDNAAQTAYGFGEGQKFDTLFSRVSIESIIFYVFAVCAYAIERLTETHQSEVRQTVGALRPHTLEWYQQKALAFRYGEAIDDATADYPSDPTGDTVMPISQCAVSEGSGGGLVMKVATADEAGNLSPLPADKLQAFETYIGRVKDAGIRTTIISRRGDRLTLGMVVYVDGTVYKKSGELISEPVRPVEVAVKTYLQRLPFNGELVLEHLTDYLQTLDGVEVPHINFARVAQVSSDGQTDTAYSDARSVDVRVTPDSGYFVVSFDSSDDYCSTIEYRFRP